MSDWLQQEYWKCRQFCAKYHEYERINYISRYEPRLKNKKTQIKYELLGILEHITDD